ncbi:hypothetical protein GSI_09501 [Ganoderma sinense ZZ0214-1]|uniref:Uncharacterized protein n=1 Tax=Ganoderma sinense ZZ0214-1 TaxID=1077348 RepID=A0A2G8S3J6_9APHY|nr:hypothetical protein GSI_09501 [Ganoderma sinense ZZ0214-1]
MSTRLKRYYRLHRLNTGILLRIFSHIQGISGSLLDLSLTCRILREVCKPIVFRNVTRKLTTAVVDPEELFPAPLSPFVQSFAIVDCCPAEKNPTESLLIFSLLGQQRNGGLLVLPEEPFLCTSLDGPGLQLCLRLMTSLRKISLASSTSVSLHGVRWPTLKAILSLPQLEEFSLIGLLFSPVLVDGVAPDEVEIPDLDHIKSFRYEASSLRASGWGTVAPSSHPFRIEETMLRRVLEKLHGSLESLTLPAQAAPIQAMAQWKWPRLRELTLRGPWWVEPRSPPLVSLFATMPRLRKLALELTLAQGPLTLTEAPPLWPRAHAHRATFAFPWPDLTHLSLSHPRADDEVFAHLPLGLRALSLCCCPHKSEKPFLDLDSTVPHGYQYQYPVLGASEMLGILQCCQCRTPQLAHLALEYNANGREREDELLRHVVVAFPDLESLEVHRYRKADDTDTTAWWGKRDPDFQIVESFGRSLGSLARLRTVKVYLDYEDAPQPFGVCGTHVSPEERKTLVPTHRKAADVLARAVSPSVESVQLWRPHQHAWLAFRVVRGPDGVVERCEEDESESQSSAKVHFTGGS